MTTQPADNALSPADYEAIREVLYRFCRGIDRGDREALERCYWPEATDDHAFFEGSAADFIEVAMNGVVNINSSHMIGNVLIELDDQGVALVEAYFQATHRLPPSNGDVEMEWILIGRYLDRMEQRHGEWRILNRIVAVDHERRMPMTPPTITSTLRAEVLGGKKPNDPLYQRLLAR